MTETPPSALALTLTYYGHCAFLWQTPQGVRALIDPYRNLPPDRYWFARRFPEVECDLALITHAHFDHDAADRLPESTSIIRMPGEFSYRDLKVRGILDRHSGPRSGRLEFPNVMFRLEASGISFLHLGDNRVQWLAEVRQAVGNIDVLMVTVDDSCHLLSYQGVEQLIAQVNLRVVVPMHYLIPGLTAESSTLKTPEQWLATRNGVKRLGRSSIVLSRESLPATTEVWVLEPAPESLAAPPVAPPAGS
jgi:L-ascorbate metabolism protein UlaG (beta-lactamase superfamily)